MAVDSPIRRWPALEGARRSLVEEQFALMRRHLPEGELPLDENLLYAVSGITLFVWTPDESCYTLIRDTTSDTGFEVLRLEPSGGHSRFRDGQQRSRVPAGAVRHRLEGRPELN